MRYMQPRNACLLFIIELEKYCVKQGIQYTHTIKRFLSCASKIGTKNWNLRSIIEQLASEIIL